MDDSARSLESELTALPDVSYSATSEDDAFSTNDLIGRDVYHSTGSLINKSINELMRGLKLPENRRYFEPTILEKVPEDTWLNNYIPASGNVPYGDIPHALDFDDAGHQKFNNYEESSELDWAKHIEREQLFDMIRKFLRRHGLSSDFLKILRRYIQLLEESDLEPSEDKYILAIRHELENTYQLSSLMDSIVTAFLLKPENMPMKLALMENKHETLVLKKSFISWRLKWKISSNLAKCESIWQLYVLKNYLHRWTEKYQLYTNHWATDAISVDSFRIISRNFDYWYDRYGIEQTKKKLADNFHIVDYVEMLKAKTEHIKLLQTRADEFYAKKSLSHTILIWRLYYRKKTSIAVLRVYSQKSVLYKLKNKTSYVKKLESLSSQVAMFFLLRPIIIKWRSKLKKHIKHVQRLIAEGNIHVKRNAYKKWRQKLQYKECEAFAKAAIDANFIAFIFRKIWCARFSERVTLYQTVSTKNNALQRNILSKWKLMCDLKHKADVTCKRNIQRRTLRQVLLLAKCQNYKKAYNNDIQISAFNHWMARYLEELKVKTFSMKLVHRYWEHELKRKFLSFDNLKYVTAKSYDSSLVKQFYSLWENRYTTIIELNEKSDLMCKLRAINKLKTGIRKTETVKYRESLFYSVSSVINLKKYLDLWRRNTLMQKELKLEVMLDSFRQESDETVLRGYMSIWLSRLDFYSQQCTVIAYEVSRRHSCKLFISRLIDKLEMHKQWEKQADSLKTSMILLSTFMSWSERVDKIETLVSLVQQYKEEKDVNLIVQCLSKWNMKTLKFRRNEETGEMFRNRWNRALLRYIITLWKDKTELMSELSSDRYYRVDNDISPNFMTPLKIDTKVVIPGSARVKKNKMQKIKDRYKGARRAIPSPIKSSTVLDSSRKKLSENEVAEPLKGTMSNSPDLPKLQLERGFKKSSTKRIDFSRVPELDPFSFPDSTSRRSSFTIDRSTISDDTYVLDESPTKIKNRIIQMD
ncbi:HHR004Wp [Eremothecium sinecaudum]|uniref:HHR004Wp n=1 Tax=Eremothecium sinecaudum TaxID=45286 RepID=A0A109V119_9SACH|nr:HHR004Wp [Eremothecium sinecaudum]AMD22773.1 HHR004Wp [Eremothecium sinecaudum]